MIAIEGLGKRFRLYQRPIDRLVEWTGLGQRSREFWALRDVSFQVPSGGSLAIIGANGAGKSTLLKLITGTLLPTTGVINAEGRIAALLELGTGFHGEFTGRQNIWINGQLLGLSPEEIAEQEREIIAFSELGDFVDQPLRTYSSGMIVRLGFSVAASVNPDILIIDEALSVGDARFSQKCIKRIDAFRAEGTTLLFVSHDPNAVSTLCDEAIFLSDGTINYRGTPSDVLEQYGAMIASKGTENSAMQIRSRTSLASAGKLHQKSTKSGNFQAIIASIELFNAKGEPTHLFIVGGTIVIQVTAVILQDIIQPTFGLLIRDHLGTDMYGTNTALQDIDLGECKAGEEIEFSIAIPNLFGEGDYSVTCALHRDETHLEECFDWTDQGAIFTNRSANRRTAIGKVLLDSEWKIDKRRPDQGEFTQILDHVYQDLGNPLPIKAVIPSPFLKGFYEPEANGDGDVYRWFGEEAECLFRRTGNSLFIRGFFPETIVDRSVKVILDDKIELGELTTDGDTIFQTSFALPDADGAQIHKVTFRAQAIHREESPVQSSGSEIVGRKLAFALFSLHTE